MFPLSYKRTIEIKGIKPSAYQLIDEISRKLKEFRGAQISISTNNNKLSFSTEMAMCGTWEGACARTLPWISKGEIEIANSEEKIFLKLHLKLPRIFVPFTIFFLIVPPLLVAIDSEFSKVPAWAVLLLYLLMIFSNYMGTVIVFTHMIKKTIIDANQRLDPIVKTPVDKVEAQGTQGHP